MSFLQTCDRLTRQLSEIHEMMVVRTSSGSDRRVEDDASFKIIIGEDMEISCHVGTSRGMREGGRSGERKKMEIL